MYSQYSRGTNHFKAKGDWLIRYCFEDNEYRCRGIAYPAFSYAIVVLCVIVTTVWGHRMQRYWFPSGETFGPIQLDIFRGWTPSLALWLTIHLSLSLAYLVTSIYIKFCSGLVTNLWPGWIVQLTHSSLPWHTLQNVTTDTDFAQSESKTMSFFGWILKLVKKYRACSGFNVLSFESRTCCLFFYLRRGVFVIIDLLEQ